MILQKLEFWVTLYRSSNKTDTIWIVKNIFRFSGMEFQEYFMKFEFLP